mmetsp:Transcript_3893/g.4576  ORF Transcript_3893/g.4576 Transcript_3893/m.4576 type:complete len:561 (-) Transcript_3893:2145-3827(-)
MDEIDNLATRAGGKKKGSMSDAADGTEAIRSWKDHLWTQKELEVEFKTSFSQGLSGAAVTAKQNEHGPNQLTEKDKIHPCILFLKEQTGFFSLLLWFGSILCFIAYGIQEDKTDESNLYLGIVLAVVVFITGVFSYSQTSKAASLMDDFKNMIPPQANVLRDGDWKDVEAKELVPGDIIRIKGGFQIPADTILFKSNEMKVNNASLTGEAEELLRKPDETHESVYESPNVAFFGTSCTNGSGEGIVFRTGDKTAIGLIANLTDSAENKQTPLSHEIERFIILISIVAMVLGVSFFLYGLLIVQYAPVDMLVFAIGIIVANVPEGLLATVTVSLALTAKRMHAKQVLVKNLESVETLGSTSCICSDKTGTLTQNRMTVSHMWIGKEIINAEVNWESYFKELEGEKAKGKDGMIEKVKVPEYQLEDKLFKELIKTLALSTTTFFNFDPKDDEVKNWYRKEQKKNKAKEISFPKDKKDWSPAHQEEWKGILAKMQVEEHKKRFMKRLTKGDASETGLVRFITPLLMNEYNGIWNVPKNEKFENRLDQFREAFPVLQDAKENGY